MDRWIYLSVTILQSSTMYINVSTTSSSIFTKLDSTNNPLSPDIVNVHPQSKMTGYSALLMDTPKDKKLVFVFV